MGSFNFILNFEIFTERFLHEHTDDQTFANLGTVSKDESNGKEGNCANEQESVNIAVALQGLSSHDEDVDDDCDENWDNLQA